MSKGTKFHSIIISKKNYITLLRWSFSLKEIGGLCFGKGQEIKFVERLTNETNSRQFFSWNQKERMSLIEKYKKKGFDLVAEFHSHPTRNTNKSPSRLDTKYFLKGKPHLICFPAENAIRCWLMCSTTKKTRNSKIEIIII